MSWWLAGIIGGTGGLLVDLAQVARVTQANDGRIPEKFLRSGFIVSVLFRIFLGAALAAIVSLEQMGPVLALSAGIAAPLIVERLARADVVTLA